MSRVNSTRTFISPTKALLGFFVFLAIDTLLFFVFFILIFSTTSTFSYNPPSGGVFDKDVLLIPFIPIIAKIIYPPQHLIFLLSVVVLWKHFVVPYNVMRFMPLISFVAAYLLILVFFLGLLPSPGATRLTYIQDELSGWVSPDDRFIHFRWIVLLSTCAVVVVWLPLCKKLGLTNT